MRRGQAAHQADIVHRDLKPENLFLTLRDGVGFAKVLDFGVSRFTAEDGGLRQTRSGITMGTPLYMAPEQLKGAKHADARSDVYSLGVILYEMVSGHVPFAADSFAELAVQVLSAEAPALDASGGGLPPALGAVVARALDKDPARRFQTAAELGAALAPFAKPEGLAALLGDEVPEPEPTGDTLVRYPAAASTPAQSEPRATPEPEGEARSFSLPARLDVGRMPLPPQLRDSLRKVAQGPAVKSRGGKRAAAGGALVVLVVAALGAWLLEPAARPVEAAVTSIAVLPFENATDDPESEYLGDGLTESVIYQLSRAPSLRVMPRGSVYRAKAGGGTPAQMAARLGVEVMLTGELTARQVVRAELIDVRSGALLWGHRWDRAQTDLIVLQRELAEGVQGALSRGDAGAPLISLSQQPRDPEAFRLYLKGRYYWNKRTADGLTKGAALFKQALDVDPGFAPAWVGLGDSLALMDQYAGVPSKENCPTARAAITRALELDPSLATAHASSALLLGHCDWDWKAAEAEFLRAIELDPNYVTAHHWFALHLAYRGLSARGLAEARTAQRLDPLSLVANNAASVVNGYAGDWAAVLQQSDRLITMDAAFPIAHMWRGRALRAKGDAAGARAEFLEAFALSDQKSLELMGELGATAALSHDEAEARRWQDRLEQALPTHPSGAMQLAMISASLGHVDEALGWLEKAFESRSWFLVQLRVEPLFAPLRDDPRFQEMIRRVNLSP